MSTGTDPTLTRAQQRQLLRALGWRGTKSKRSRKYVRPEFRPYVEPVATPVEEG
jgi:hypothetical protein